MKRIAMICFGDVMEPKNGYAMRCKALANQLIEDGNFVAIYQFSDKSGTAKLGRCPVYSLKVKHEGSKTKLEKLFGLDPFKAVYFIFEGYRRLRAYKAQLKNADEICIEGCLLLNAFIFAKLLKKPITLDTHCINKEVALKMRSVNKVMGTVRTAIWHIIEKGILSNVNNVIAISGHDKESIQKHYKVPAEKISIIHHQVDTANAKAHQQEAKNLRKTLASGYKKVVCFVGDLGAIQNIETHRFITKTLAPATPEVRYILVGNNPQNFKTQGNVFYTGYVDRLDPYILMADACIAPMAIGSGVKTKMLDYLKYNKKVIATPVAAEGIEQSSYNITICDLADFVRKTKEFVGSAA